MSLCVGCALILGLTACNFSSGGKSGETVANLTALPAPSNVRVDTNEYVFWEEVPNASSYIVKINGYQESSGNALKYSISSIMDSHIDYNVETELSISVKAKGNQILYSDSEWSSPINYSYTKKRNGGNDNPTNLPTPKGLDYVDNEKIVWDTVENADYYLVNYQTDTGENEEVVRYANYMYLSFKQTTNFKFRIKCIAPEGSNKSDSSWTEWVSASFKKTDVSNKWSSDYRKKV